MAFFHYIIYAIVAEKALDIALPLEAPIIQAAALQKSKKS